MMKLAKNHLNFQGIVLARRLNGDYCLSDVVSSADLVVDHSLQTKLARSDRSFWYSEIVLGFHDVFLF